MGIQILSTFTRGPSGTGNWALTKDTDNYGGFRVVATVASLTDGTTIPSNLRTQGMRAIALDSGLDYELAVDLTTWSAKNYGITSAYQTVQNAGVGVAQRSTINLPAGSGLLAADVSSKTELSVDQGFSPTWAGNHTFSNPVVGATPTLSTHLTTKAYVDSIAQGITWKNAVRAIATSNVTLSGAQTIDGVAVVAGDRVVTNGQSTASQNGLWVAAAGAWARPADWTTGNVAEGDAVFVGEGTINASTGWVLTTTGTITVGTTAVSFTQFTGVGEIVAPAPLAKSGNTLSLNIGTGLTTSGSNLVPDFGSGAGKVTQGNDARLPPAPATLGNLIYDTGSAYAALADVAAGSYLRSGGVGAAPLWSTTTLPNAATTGDLMAATGSNAFGRIAAAAANQFFQSAGASTLPAWVATPVFAAGLTASGATANDFSGGTGNFLASTGNFSWAGASTKTVSIVSTGAGSTITITAGAVSSWDTDDGTIKAATHDRTTAGTMTLGGTATTVQLAANVTLSGAAGTGAVTLGSMTGDTTLPTGNASWTAAAGKLATLSGPVLIQPPATTGAPNSALKLVPASHTALTAEFNSVLFDGSGTTQQYVKANIPTLQRTYRLRAVTYSSDTSSTTLALAATLYVNAAPTAGTNLVITNPLAFAVENGNVLFGNNLAANGGTNTNASYLGLNVVPTYGYHQLANGSRLQAAADPTSVTVTQGGAAGTTRVDYVVIGKDAAGNKTVGTYASTLTSNATLSGSNFNTVSWTRSAGTVSVDIYRFFSGAGGNGGTLGSVSLANTGTSFNDQGGAASAYTLPTRNATADDLMDGFDGNGTLTPLASIHQVGSGSLNVALATPGAPTITPTGADNSQTNTYYIVAYDAAGNQTLQSATGTNTHGPTTLSTTNYITITWSAVTGAVFYDVVATARGSSPGTTGAIGSKIIGTSYVDTGLSANAYTAPISNTTAMYISQVDNLLTNAASPGIYIRNTQPSTVSNTQQIAPGIQFESHAWKSNATAVDQKNLGFVGYRGITGAAATTSEFYISMASAGAATFTEYFKITDGTLIQAQQNSNFTLKSSATMNGSVTGAITLDTVNTQTSGDKSLSVRSGGTELFRVGLESTVNGVSALTVSTNSTLGPFFAILNSGSNGSAGFTSDCTAQTSGRKWTMRGIGNNATSGALAAGDWNLLDATGSVNRMVVKTGTALIGDGTTLSNSAITSPGATWAVCTTDVRATTSPIGLSVINSALSTASILVQRSGQLEWAGHVWNTTAVAADNYAVSTIQMVPTSANSPSTQLNFSAYVGTSNTRTYTLYMTWSDTNTFTAQNVAGTKFTQSVQTTGSPNTLTVTGAAHTALTASAEASDLLFSLNRTVQFSTGALTTQRAIKSQAPTYGFVGASTLTTAVHHYLDNAPVVGTNATFTNAYNLYLDSANNVASSGTITEAASLYIKGAPTSGGTITNAYALKVAAGNSIFLGDVSARHLVGNGGAPTISTSPATGIQFGVSPTASIQQGTDTGGVFKLTTGTGTIAFIGGTAVTVAVVAFANAYAATPTAVVLVPADPNGAQAASGATGVEFYVDYSLTDTGHFTIKAIDAGAGTLAASTSFYFTYHVIQ